LVLGYRLGEAHVGSPEEHSQPLYLLPGGMVLTGDMAKGITGASPAWAEKGE